MTDATQQSDRLPLTECLSAMRRLGTPDEYIRGYDEGFNGSRYEFGRGSVYARGRLAGMDALNRGAHGTSEARVIGIIDRDGAP